MGVGGDDSWSPSVLQVCCLLCGLSARMRRFDCACNAEIAMSQEYLVPPAVYAFAVMFEAIQPEHTAAEVAHRLWSAASQRKACT